MALEFRSPDTQFFFFRNAPLLEIAFVCFGVFLEILEASSVKSCRIGCQLSMGYEEHLIFVL